MHEELLDAIEYEMQAIIAGYPARAARRAVQWRKRGRRLPGRLRLARLRLYLALEALSG